MLCWPALASSDEVFQQLLDRQVEGALVDVHGLKHHINALTQHNIQVCGIHCCCSVTILQFFDRHNFQCNHCFLHFSTGRQYSQQSCDIWSNPPYQFHPLSAMLQRIRSNWRAMAFSHSGRKYGNHSGQYKISLRQNYRDSMRGFQGNGRQRENFVLHCFFFQFLTAVE